MKLSSCVACTLPVLELEGQFEKLDSYYLAGGSPALATAGWWHARCLIESEVGPSWYAARLANYREVRGHTVVAELPAWTVVTGPRGDRLAFGRNGQLLSLGGKPTRTVPGGAIHPHVDREFNLELSDLALAEAIKQGLSTAGTYPLLAVFEGLGIADRVAHAEALDGGVFRYVADLAGYWSPRSVSARAEYGTFMPAELEPYS